MPNLPIPITLLLAANMLLILNFFMEKKWPLISLFNEYTIIINIQLFRENRQIAGDNRQLVGENRQLAGENLQLGGENRPFG